jgi:peroxiredoxin Q/BCP
MAEVAAGDKAPSFRAADDAGAPFGDADLRGRPYVLWFFPKADTPG